MSTLSSEEIKTEAARLGFDLCGVAELRPPVTFHAYAKWLDAGYAADMAYLATERARQIRANPAQALPGARAVIVLGVRYPDPRSITTPPANQPRGRVAAYAWGDDYHDILPLRLRSLAERLAARLNRPISYRVYTDTGPLLERDLAQQAGLGWAGKNTCLIHPRRGSYYLLAEILVDIDLPADDPFTTDQCGSCRRCIDACPTGCILSDRTIDSYRCISYLTIEHKAAIPPDLRTSIGNWIFGCDICQQVCPWNVRFSDLSAGTEFAPRPGVPQPVLRDELALRPADFNRKFHHSPIRRAKRRGYLRNVAVALGNQSDPGSVHALAAVLLAELEPLPRGHAAWALGQIGGAAARAALEKARRSENDPAVQGEIDRALEVMAATEALSRPPQ